MNKRTPEEKPYVIRPCENSIRIIVKSFFKEFRNASQKIDCDYRGKLNYSQFVRFFKEMNYLDAHRKPTSEELVVILSLWESLNDGSGYVQNARLKDFMIEQLVYKQQEKYARLIKNRITKRERKAELNSCLLYTSPSPRDS